MLAAVMQFKKKQNELFVAPTVIMKQKPYVPLSASEFYYN